MVNIPDGPGVEQAFGLVERRHETQVIADLIDQPPLGGHLHHLPPILQPQAEGFLHEHMNTPLHGKPQDLGV